MRKTLKPFIIPDDYPFHLDLEAQRRLIRTGTHSVTYERERVTISKDKDYLPRMFVKVFQNKHLLRDLTPAACKVFIYMISDIGYQDTMVQISRNDMAMGKNQFYAALLELTHCNIIRKVPNKREMYWINLSLLVNGDPHNKHG